MQLMTVKTFLGCTGSRSRSRSRSINVLVLVTHIHAVLSSPCPSSMMLIQRPRDRCIQFGTDTADWVNAQEACARDESALVKIWDDETYSLISNSLDIKNYYWTALTYDFEHQVFRWTGDDQAAALQVWFPPRPNSPGNDCACLKKETPALKLFPCEVPLHYLCESAPEICPDGNVYGPTCSEPCSPFCNGTDGKCYKLDGSCVSGCVPGYQGRHCNTS
ncbi:hypothetical protein EGW08_009396, partial [Elysia chlorotica]